MRGRIRGAMLLGSAVVLGATAPARAGSTERVSVSSRGKQANGSSFTPALSADGRFVAFISGASNLVPGDTDGAWDVFVRDRATGRTEPVSVGPDGVTVGAGGPTLSAGARFVAFVAEHGGPQQVFVRDRETGTTEQASVSSRGEQGDWHSSYPAVAADGRFVAFYSEAANLVPGDTDGVGDIFVRDRLLERTERVSVSSRGEQGDDILSYVAATISARGRFVAFSSYASNLVPGDTNGFADVFVRDRKNGTTERVSVSSRGAQGDGRSDGGWITGDGRFVAFYSEAANLVPGDTDGVGDIFVRDRKNGTTERVSVSSRGRQANDASYLAAANRVITLDGRFVVFESDASNLIPGDTNGRRDVFVRDRRLGTTERVSVSSGGAQANGESSEGVISGGDAGYVAFASSASNLVSGDTNRHLDIFVRTR